MSADYDVYMTVTVRAESEEEAINEVARKMKALDGLPPELPMYPVAHFDAVERNVPPHGWTTDRPVGRTADTDPSESRSGGEEST